MRAEVKVPGVHLLPHVLSLVLTFTASVAIGLWAWVDADHFTVVDAYVSVVWTLPTLSTLIALQGLWRTRRRARVGRTKVLPNRCAVADQLIVVIPSIGRHDTMPGLIRVIDSMENVLPRYFPHVRIDVVMEERCAAAAEIITLGAASRHVRVVVVPHEFRTVHGTQFKARAIHYAHLVRLDDNEARSDVWVLHMDDDTAVGEDTAAALAAFVLEQDQAGENALHLCQGVLCYPREVASSHLLWMADSVRPGCDVGLFSATTGRGSPHAGLHGEMLMIRASVEAAIGWDFGPRTIVEDAQFALIFAQHFPGRSGWVPARSYGSSPTTTADFVKQRERWVWGLLELASGKAGAGIEQVQLRHRLLMVHNVAVWSLAPLGHPSVVLLACLTLGDFSTAPVTPWLIPCWALNFAYCLWLYWDGLRLNANASKLQSRTLWEVMTILALMPVFSLLEVIGIVRGVLQFSLSAEPRFTVIAKPS